VANSSGRERASAICSTMSNTASLHSVAPKHQSQYAFLRRFDKEEEKRKQKRKSLKKRWQRGEFRPASGC
jgi:hypothetical protein